VSSQKLRRKYGLLAFHDGESVEDFSMRLMSLTNQLVTLGDPEPEDKIIKKYLHVARPRYRQLVVSIESLLDIASLSVEEITTWLKAVEDDEGLTGNRDSGEKLYLTEEEWLECYKQKDPEGSHRGGASGGCGGKKKTMLSSDSGGNGPVLSHGSDKWCTCGKIGHWARECHSSTKREEQAHVAEEGEGTLLLAHAEVNGSDTLPTPNLIRIEAEVARQVVVMQRWPFITSSAPKRRVELVEMEVYVVLGDGGEGDPKRWIFDTGASIHMTSIKEAFTDLNTGIIGMVRFGDGSIVQIKCCGTMLFTCKNGEHRTLANTYYIMRLTTNIISYGQLGEVGF
jgi:hypothetical protein